MSQALVDSIHDLIKVQQDVADSLSWQGTTTVMIPVSPVAFMPGEIIGESALVSLGQDYYVDRSFAQAKQILERRLSGALRFRVILL